MREDDLSKQRTFRGAFEGETLTRRRMMTSTAHATAAVAVAGFTLPVLGFAVGPIFDRLPTTWQPIGAPEDFPADKYIPRVITLGAGGIGEASKTTVFVRRRNPAIDREPEDRWNHFVAVTSRCAHIGCPVNYVDAAKSFVCPCHGGVYDFRALRVGGPPPRPLDRFFTRVHAGRVEVGPRYSVNSKLQRFSPRDPGQSLDGIGPLIYPARPSTAEFPR